MQKWIANLVTCFKKSRVPFLFSILLCLAIHVWIVQYFFYFAENFNIIMSVARKKNNIQGYPIDSKFILAWNKYDNMLKRFKGRNVVLNCLVCNCVFTEDKNMLYDIMSYDAIIFNEVILNSVNRPHRRSNTQLYVFASQKSSHDAPACDLYNDNFFNFTFTYKLDSDVLWSYIVVRNVSGAMVGPSASVTWENGLKPVPSDIEPFLKRKREAAVWIVNDEPNKATVKYITSLQEHLLHYSLRIDVYGQQTKLTCPSNDCRKTIREKYYFYMAFENTFSEDYVTNLVLRAYNNYAVPVVYGGANYSRFLPDGSYINAGEISSYNLAAIMHKTIKDPGLYEKYFIWKNLYTIEDNSKSSESLCALCETVHGFKANASTKLSKRHFRRWWNGLDEMKGCLSDASRSKRIVKKPKHILHLLS